MIYIIITQVKANDAGENQKIDASLQHPANALCEERGEKKEAQ